MGEGGCKSLLNQCEMCCIIDWAAVGLNLSSINKLKTNEFDQYQEALFAKIRYYFAVKLSVGSKI
jgi:hypothetical protein